MKAPTKKEARQLLDQLEVWIVTLGSMQAMGADKYVADGRRLADAYVGLRKLGFAGYPAEPQQANNLTDEVRGLEAVREWLERYVKTGKRQGTVGRPTADMESLASRMRQAVDADYRLIEWSQRKWAKHLGCAVSSVDNSYWVEILKLRKQAKDSKSRPSRK